MEDTNIKNSIEQSILAWIDVRQHYGVEIIGLIQGSIIIEKEKVNEDLLTISARIEKEDDITYSFPCKLEVKRVEVERDILNGWLTLEQYYPNSGYELMYGNLSYERDTKSVDLLQGSIEYNAPIESNLLKGKVHINEDELNEVYKEDEDNNTIEITIPKINEETGKIEYEISSDGTIVPSYITITRKKHEFEGHLKYKEDNKTYNLLKGSLTIPKGKLSDNGIEIIDGSLNIKKELSKTELNGYIKYDKEEKVIDLFSKCSLERNDVVEELLDGNVTLENQNVDIELLSGSINITDYYSAMDFPCRIKVNKQKFVHSIFARIDVPPNKEVEIPCTIEVDGNNYFKQVVLEGSIKILKEDLSVDLMRGYTTLLPTIHTDIDCSAKVNPIYTRREFNANINVVHNSSLEIPAKIEVTPPADYWYWQEILKCFIAVGSKFDHDISSSIEVKQDDSIRIHSTLPKQLYHHSIPKARIAIVVSPTWRYEAFVFKSCLVTFLDRYYGKVDLDIVFGGNPRADFDIINLAANYHIKKENLLRVPIITDFHDRSKMQESVDHFIRHMIFSKTKNSHLARVFIFMNQPSWYYNDPVGKIAQFCKDNEISCVCINSGGEYQEMTTIDRARDEALNFIEWDRQQRMHPNYKYEFVTMKPNDDPNRIVYYCGDKRLD